ncbi:unnamed protein product [Dibothriocephalus latus]|uniref:Uncharacterized protein n=1 Tax=Dibothriocephalus latus TaxID=60516 RepID=A0A3P7MCK3_DIBLA|nr:unnamed protein product [Dibothriocephalus latus]
MIYSTTVAYLLADGNPDAGGGAEEQRDVDLPNNQPERAAEHEHFVKHTYGQKAGTSAEAGQWSENCRHYFFSIFQTPILIG